MKALSKFTLILSLSLLSFATFGKSFSTYTTSDFDKCQQGKTQTDGIYQAKCQGLGGYKVEILGAELRQAIAVSYGERTVSYQPLSPFYVGKTIEWRYRYKGNAKDYYALIHRVAISKYDEDEEQFSNNSPYEPSLVVIRLAKEKSCILGIIPSSANMNEQARALADNPNAMCKPELNYAK